uniref:WD repeat domain 49 n=1 Tax=Equus caballus TaxID=9796 RepID=F6XH43_HORSE
MFLNLSRCKNLLLTGGLDRIIRVWNPYLPRKPTGMLKSHTAPVSYIQVSAEDNKIFSTSTDNAVKIWDLETDSSLFTVSSKASGLKGELAACLYLPGPRALWVASDTAVLLHLRLRSPPEPHLVLSHKEPVGCCWYNPASWQVVSCSEASVIWHFETGRLLSEFTEAHDNAGITCLIFDSGGRRYVLITGGRDGCLKIWSYNNEHCLHSLKHGNVLAARFTTCTTAPVWLWIQGTAHDFHHFWKPQPHWQDDLSHGHKEDILCVAQCPPFLLATSSYDGEIIIWNVISGHIYCKLNTSTGAQSLSPAGLSNSAVGKAQTPRCPATASLLAGSVTFWRLSGGACPIANFTPSRDKAWVSSMVVTAGDALACVADQESFVRVYNIKEYSLWGPELRPPKNVTFWRAHVSMVTSLELIEEEKFLLSSSLDLTVRLWSMDGEYTGTFGQSSPWDVFTPASWSHPRVPYEILTDAQSMPAHPVLEGDVPAVIHGLGTQGDSAPCSTQLSHLRETDTENSAHGTLSPL